MTAELNTKRIYTELSQLRQEVQTLRIRVEALTPSRRPSLRTEHPHIVRSEGVHGGRPIIRGTGVSVQTIVEQTRLGLSPAITGRTGPSLRPEPLVSLIPSVRHSFQGG